MVILTNKRGAHVLSCVTAIVFFVIIGTLHYAFAERPSPPENSTELPVLMYHMVRDIKSTSKYVVSPKQVESDFEYIKTNGYTPISSAQLIAYVGGAPSPLPEKPILITFDDGYYNNYLHVYPLLQKYNFPAVVSVIGSQADFYSVEGSPQHEKYTHITWDKLNEMRRSGLVEIGNHTYDLHNTKKRNGILRKRAETAEEYKQMLTDDISRLQNLLVEKVGATSVSFAYPFGCINKESKAIIEGMGFSITFGCQEGINYIVANDPACLLTMKRYNRSGKRNTESIFKKFAR
ncbi:MAG: polysaccharide deacetylase family protein [Clostridiales bacterium]|jgi:peptidoglycan/xylan/chitin deacetylase (PgdA/CDA1 family)|nr:polysaccharide deacetylase family protein [Clostridiales bacterium]